MLERKFAVLVFLVSTVLGSVLASNKHPAGQLHVTLPMPPTTQLVKTEMTPTPFDETAPTQVSTDNPAALPAETGKASSSACQAAEGLDSKALARRFMVQQAEVLSWFCQGYGFGEVELAYVISAYAHVPVNEVFDRRASGLGWGQIEQDYGLKGHSKQALNSHKNNKAGGKNAHVKGGKHGKKP